jgi:hypothetical protein
MGPGSGIMSTHEPDTNYRLTLLRKFTMIITSIVISGLVLAHSVGVGYAGAKLYLWDRLRLKHSEQVAARKALDSLDRHVAGEVEDMVRVGPQPANPIPNQVGPIKKVKLRKRAPFISACARAAKVQFGLPEDTLANRMCVRKYLADLMKEHGMRPIAVSQFLDIAVEMVFIPTEDELRVWRMRQSMAFIERRAAYKYKPSWDFVAWLRHSSHPLPLRE